MSLSDYSISKTFVRGVLAGLTVEDEVLRHDDRLGPPFVAGQKVDTTYASYIVRKVEKISRED